MTSGRTHAVLIVLASTLLWMSGCTTVAKQAFHELRGAQADLLFIDHAPCEDLATYDGVKFNPVSTTIGDELCPYSLRSKWDRCAAREEGKLRGCYPGGEKTLSVDAEILYFQKKGLLGSAQLLSRVRMRAGGTVVVDVLVNTMSKAFRAGGASALAETSVEAVAKFLRKQKAVEEEDAEDADEDEYEDDDGA